MRGSDGEASTQPNAAKRAPALQRLIVVDQLGYPPGMTKVAVLVDPVSGWNGTEDYTPGSVLEVRRKADDSVAFSGAPSPWNDGKLDAHAGDRGAWFDFSALKEEGAFYVWDASRKARSAPFRIATDVYQDALRAAARAFFFNRANVAKRAPFACVGKQCWVAEADHVGPGQDGEARSLRARDDGATARDLRGGWWDAGDTNKYVTFSAAAVHQLLAAYAQNPAAFGDDFGIPESKNGVPDVLDEVQVELEWLQKMQPADLGGGALLKLGNVEYDPNPPALSKLPRYYIPGACSSATVAVASMFAHAAVVFRAVPALEGRRGELIERAERAFSHFQTHEKSASCDDNQLTGGDADWGIPQQEQMETVAAIYLSLATGKPEYARHVREHFRQMRPFLDDRWSMYDSAQGDALLDYATHEHADSEVKSAIESRMQSLSARALFAFRPEDDLYRAFLPTESFHWGSNMVRANLANATLALGLSVPASGPLFQERSLGLLHFFHGVNALGLVYLSNMAPYGAERSVTEIFHAWFRDGDETWDSAISSKLGPAPGFVAGGPNRQYCRDENAKKARCFTSELSRQPPEKAYLDFNTGYAPEREHDRSWEISEPGIYYQSAYVQLVSKFVR